MKKEGGRSGWWLTGTIIVIMILLLIGIFSLGDFEDVLGNVAVIKITGEIVTEGERSFGKSVLSSTDIIDFIDEAEENPTIKAVMFEINSPGGSAVASQEVVERIKTMKKPKISVIRETGASGAYWIAAATDWIIANPMSITGSVGVTASYPEFADFLKRYNVTYQRIVAGKYKDVGNPLAKQSKEELDILQEAIDLIHQIFLDDVKSARQLTKEQVDQISTGRFFLGAQAKDLNLIDQLGTKEDAKGHLEENLNITVGLVEYERPKGFFESLFGAEFAYNFGFGVGSALRNSELISSVDIKT
jgi:protease-4